MISPDSTEARINPDEVLATSGGDWRNVKDQASAMRECVKMLHRYIEEGVSFNQETTLSGKSVFAAVRSAKKHGYSIKLFYIGVESADLAIKRVHQRVEKGGHGIDDATVRRRYSVSMEALKRIIPLCDVVEIFDNSIELTSVAKYKDGKWVEFDGRCQWLASCFNVS